MGPRIAVRAGRGVGCAVALFVLATLCAADAGGHQSPVSLGELKNRAAADSQIERSFRRAVERELLALDLSGVQARDRYVLSATLVRVETHARDRESETTAVVSATLRRAKGGALHAVIEGRARAFDDKSASRAASVSAVRGAVRSAVGRVPDALR